MTKALYAPAHVRRSKARMAQYIATHIALSLYVMQINQALDDLEAAIMSMELN